MERASKLAQEKLVAALPRRWQHVCGVARKARNISSIVPADDQELLIAAAWLHDIGYAPTIAVTGFHALDGARWLRQYGFDDRLASLVAHHSCATFEAEERGLAGALADEFDREQSLTADALWYADMTTSPDGDDVSVAERLVEVSARYGADHLVTRFWVRAEGTLLEAVKRVEDRLTAHQPM